MRERVGGGKDYLSLRTTRRKKVCCAARDVTTRAALALTRQPSLLRRGLATCVTTVKSELLYLCKQAPIQPPPLQSSPAPCPHCHECRPSSLARRPPSTAHQSTAQPTRKLPLNTASSRSTHLPPCVQTAASRLPPPPRDLILSFPPALLAPPTPGAAGEPAGPGGGPGFLREPARGRGAPGLRPLISSAARDERDGRPAAASSVVAMHPQERERERGRERAKTLKFRESRSEQPSVRDYPRHPLPPSFDHLPSATAGWHLTPAKENQA